ncbi:MAG: hypothetical protein ABIM88_08680 [candidate division WOR-3 bacterium]
MKEEKIVMTTMLWVLMLTGFILALTSIILLFCPWIKEHFSERNSAFVLALPPLAVASYVLVFSFKVGRKLTAPYAFKFLSWDIGGITLAQILWASLLAFLFYLAFTIATVLVMSLFKK